MPRASLPWFLAFALVSAPAGSVCAQGAADEPSERRAEWVRVAAPEEGSTVSGTLHVVFEVSADAKAAARGIEIYLFVDDVLRGHTKDSQSDIKLVGVASGAHMIVLLGKSASGAMLPRKEVRFSVISRDRPD